MSIALTDPCPCGGETYGTCCAKFHSEEARVATAEELMRARYSAFVAEHADFLWKSWHPRNRPELITFDDTEWLGLEILDVVEGESEGIVEFIARYRGGELHERSRFLTRARRWMYLDGEYPEQS